MKGKVWTAARLSPWQSLPFSSSMYVRLGLIFLSLLPLSLCQDGSYCNEILNIRFPFARLTTKCSLWVFALAPDLFPLELHVAREKRLLVSSYCPLSCSHPCESNTKAATTEKTKTTTKKTTTTTVGSAQRVAEIMQNDPLFRGLLNYLGDLSPEESLRRYDIYLEKKSAVDKHNEMYTAGLSSYTMAINKFSVMDEEEIAPNSLSVPPSSTSQPTSRIRRRRSVSSIDWRPFMTNVTDQKKCGGCWAFAMTAMLEGSLTIRGNVPLALSVQQLLDCDRSLNPEYNLANQGCAGGYLNVATDYLSKKPLKAANIYTFTGTSSTTCRTDVTGPALLSAFNAEYTASDDPEILEQLNEEMENRVRKGPVAVGFANSDQIYAYGSGIFEGSCGKTINHAVVIVGFTEDYWIVRNSWGSNWGEQGYIRIRRAPRTDPCKMVQYWATAASSVIPPAQNNAVTQIEMETTTILPKEGICDDCDSCGCEADEEEEKWTEDGTAFVWIQ